ncbi:MAG: TIGR02206 family membrane protein [Clostridiaceae bacterium]|jgi:hypothetical integral membrane protein (TIGR02206 family)|nr:TIGR02206 family membrane protein [Clostridiaceae bacterium]
MDHWIIFGKSNGNMIPYSTHHVIPLVITAVSILLLILLRKRLRDEKSNRISRYILAAFISIQQASIYIWYTAAGEWSLSITLPLQMCDLSLFLTIAVLLTRKQLLSELLYYWGLGGATQAMLTPAIGPYTFPHFVYYQYFISHWAILFVCTYILAVDKFKPSGKSVIRTFLITNAYAALILPINKLTGGNYLFLSWKPEASLLDLLGPWPWYILSLEGVALVLFILMYLPFAFGGKKDQRPEIPLSS